MSDPTVKLTLDLGRVHDLRPEDKPTVVSYPDLVYVVRVIDGTETVEAFVVFGDVELKAVRRP